MKDNYSEYVKNNFNTRIILDGLAKLQSGGKGKYHPPKKIQEAILDLGHRLQIRIILLTLSKAKFAGFLKVREYDGEKRYAIKEEYLKKALTIGRKQE